MAEGARRRYRCPGVSSSADELTGPGVPVTLEPLNDARWKALIDASDGALAFHHPAWLSLVREQYGYEIGAWAVSASDGALTAGLPFARVTSRLTGRRTVALPFSDACPVVTAGWSTPRSIATLADAIKSTADQGEPIEVRTTVPGLPGACSPAFYRHTLPLALDVQQVVDGFTRSHVRRGVAKAHRSGVEVVHRTDVEALDAFYELHLRNRRRLGVPTQPKSFIRRFAGLFAEGLGFVSLAVWEQRTIAAAVFLSYGGTLIYKYGASDSAHLGKRPNNAIFMDAIEWGCRTGHRQLDFGRTDLDNEGLRAFKRSWGAGEELLAYTHLPPREPPSASAGRQWTASMIRRLPPGFGRLVGTVLYRHFG